MATPAQVAAQALSNLARIGAFVGVGATVLSSAIYDGKSLKEFVATHGKRLFFFDDVRRCDFDFDCDCDFDVSLIRDEYGFFIRSSRSSSALVLPLIFLNNCLKGLLMSRKRFLSLITRY